MRTIGVAFAVPEPWAAQLSEARAAAGDPLAGFIPPHLTLLGPAEVPAERAAQVDEHLSRVAAGAAPFTLQLRGTGTFRPVTDVVFVAVARGISECEQLQAALRTGPLDRELRFPYHPHVTVAHDVPGEALDRAFDELAGFDATFEVRAFTLYEHGEDGTWRPRRDFALAGR
ncbi:2'-5' RNA ligase family protein [Longispora albida]|uniref:2'-5' RNA ligase family protein n=1 Tax=Longispora albida TaxID=203523 RepID=UPI00037BF44A|nr:2'-5' RNA ligase family protein [Longispora albida]